MALKIGFGTLRKASRTVIGQMKIVVDRYQIRVTISPFLFLERRLQVNECNG
jgi:hypothetical protein